MLPVAAGFITRADRQFAFSRTAFFDDGTNGDATAADGVFTSLLDASRVKQWYIAAEGEEGAATLPERASFKF